MVWEKLMSNIDLLREQNRCQIVHVIIYKINATDIHVLAIHRRLRTSKIYQKAWKEIVEFLI